MTSRYRRFAVAAVVVVVGGCGSGSSKAPAGSAGPNVKSDLQGLLEQKGPADATVNSCVHQNGNQYVCDVTVGGRHEFANVTDDGKYVYEQGIG